MPQAENNSYEAETVVGLEKLAAQELRRAPWAAFVQKGGIRPGTVRFEYGRSIEVLKDLKLTQAVYKVLHFAVPRPKALLGHAYFRQLTMSIVEVLGAMPEGAFKTLGIDAAGADSSVMQRIKRDLSDAVGLAPVQEDRGDLLVRIIPAVARTGWECLIRLTPRPLATRYWRSFNFPASLNATVAQAMVQLVLLRADDVFVNLCCGSGSLLIERMAGGVATSEIVGIDIDEDTLRLAKANIQQANAGAQVKLWVGDAQRSPLPNGCATALVADLPFGQRSGSHRENIRLYPNLLEEAARIAREQTLFAVLTHELRLMEEVLTGQSDWHLVETLPIVLRGLHPRIYLLKRLS
jgi:23S rRNA G2445 N2-methylase RlmL